jgi:branched-chain amino acid transport system substrate-binding protein
MEEERAMGTCVRTTALVGGTLAAMVLAGCGGTVGGGSSSSSSSDTLKIGFVSTSTGSSAPFGEANTYVISQMKTYFAGHPLAVGGKKLKVQIIVKDSQSDSTRAGQVAGDLINKDHVDLVMASSTPDIVDPVSEQCEANAVPCITTVAPWQPFAIRDKSGKPADLKYSFHFFWGLEDVAAVYADMWTQVSTNKKAAGLFPNDPDGQAWSANFPSLTKSSGATIDNPGLFPDGTKDFSAQVSKFKGHDILLGVPIPPDFTTFWRQAKQQGYSPKIATIGKALLFPSSVEALGASANNLGTEVWWTPTAPFTSSLTGQSAQQLADAYEKATGRQWTQPLGFAHALFEVAAAAVTKAGSTDPSKIVSVMKSLSMDTVVGPFAWGKPGVPPYVAKTELTGGQWRRTSGGKHPFQLVVVSNKLAPAIPKGGSVEPLS